MCKRTLTGAQLFHQKVRGGNDRREFGWMYVAAASLRPLHEYRCTQRRNVIAMSGLRSIAGTPQARRWVVLLLIALLMLSAVPAHAWRGYWGHRVFVAPRVVVPVVPFWPPYVYPPAVVQSPPPVVIQPSPPQASWYHCDNPRGYYPYVQQCPGGWRPVAPTPSP